MSLNKVQLIGNLGQDPEVRTSQGGQLIANLSVATSETWRDKTTGEKKERTEWHRVVVFNESAAKFAQQYLKKGNRVYVEGQAQTRKWQDKDGRDQYTTEIVITAFRGDLQSLERPTSNRPPAADSPSDYGRETTRDSRDHDARQMDSMRGSPGRDMDDDIPF